MVYRFHLIAPPGSEILTCVTQSLSHSTVVPKTTHPYPARCDRRQ